MIKSRRDLKLYLQKDKESLGINRRLPIPLFDIIWKYERRLRKTEYFLNTNKKLRYVLSRILFKKISIKLNISIPLNVFDYGLCIVHYGTIVVNDTCRIGKNCRIQEGVTIGATNGIKQGPILGDNVYLGSGCKIIGNIFIASNVQVGAGAVVVKSINDSGTTWAGIPAKKISNHDSKMNIPSRT